MKRALGTCYYPEHWPDALWADDAARMVDLGLTWVRIGEFAWAKLEPEPRRFAFDWLDRAIETFGAAGLKIVLGTPSATPPRWMLDRHPDMLATDAQGHPRGFGSRRHYCFSHAGYRAEAGRMAARLAERYGASPYILAWQIDNEYGCHDTILSYSRAAAAGFRAWLRARYDDIDALNQAWGTVFWSMAYQSFDQIDLPHLTVTEPNPAHVMDFRRFSSDQVLAFNAVQVAAIRAHSTAPLSHNYMGRITDFDHFALGQDLEIATWDSYPLGFLEDRVEASDDHKRRYARQGDPDFQAFHHDLYRAVGKGRWWIMEQQPGPVNWAPSNPAPLPGMVRLWTWEAFAHGAEVVSYFRWRQLPFGQEQMHSGLLRPDNAPAPAMAEIAEVVGELAAAPQVAVSQAPVALVFDYKSVWSWQVQPQGQGCDYFRLVLDIYRALRAAGLSIDILPPETVDFTGYALAMIPGLEMPEPGLVAAIQASGAAACFGPRFGSKTKEYAIPIPLPPAIDALPVTVERVETLRTDCPIPVDGGGAVMLWREMLETDVEGSFAAEDGHPVLVQMGDFAYLAGWPDAALAARIVQHLTQVAGLSTTPLPEGVRIRDAGATRFVFNHGSEPVTWEGHILPPAGVLQIPA